MSIDHENHRSRGTRWWGWGALRASFAVLAIVAVVAAIVVSPLLFRALARYATGWTDMANVGDAYGGVAAVLSGLALGGVALSLLLQWRQTTADRTLAVRQLHFELVKLALERPLLLGMPLKSQAESDIAMLETHANLWVAHWAMLWDLRHCDEVGLRHLATHFFGNHPVAREWWLVNGPKWSTRWNKHRRRFHEILNEECLREGAGTTVPAPPADGPGPVNDSRRTEWPGAVLVALGVIAGGVLTAVLRARRRQVERPDLHAGDEGLPLFKGEAKDGGGRVL